LYNGFAPDSGARLTRNAGSENRSAGLDMTFSADKSVSALWVVAGPELRSRIERAHNDAARVALEETVLRYCAWTRIRNSDGEIEVLPADIAAALFQHGASRDNDPQLHTHCVIFNAARTHRDGKWRAMRQHPVYGWMKAAGAVYRNALAWNLRQRLGIAMEHYGREDGVQPVVLIMLVFRDVSSMKASRCRKSRMKGCRRLIQRARSRTTSGRPCSAARSVFFYG